MPYVLPIKSIKSEHKSIVGDKAYSLSLLFSHDIPILEGFVITVSSQTQFCKYNELTAKIKRQLEIFDLRNPQSIISAVNQIQNIIKSSQLPSDIADQVFESYDGLLKSSKTKTISVRTSLINENENTPHPLYLNVSGEHTLLELVKESYAKLITPQYLRQTKLGCLPSAAIFVQPMFDSISSGFLHTIDPYTNNKRVFVIEAVWGLAEILKNQEVTRDKYCVDKQSQNITLRKTFPQHIEQIIEDKSITEKAIPFSKQLLPKLKDNQILQLCKFAKQAAKISSLPQTLEWGFDGDNFTFFQTQNLIEVEVDQNINKEKLLSLPIIIEGTGDNPGMGKGILISGSDHSQSFSGDIVILEEFNPELATALKHAEGIINADFTNQREVKFFCQQEGIPLINVSVENIKYLKIGQFVTIDGSTGYIYKGSFGNQNQDLTYERELTIQPGEAVFTQIQNIQTKAKVYTNLESVNQNKIFDSEISDGICLIKGESLIFNLGSHPLSLISAGESDKIIDQLKKQLLALKRIESNKPIFYQFSDLISSQLYNLNHASDFETIERIPFLGFRGSWRHVNDPRLFKCELKAITTTFEHSQINLVLPFFRIGEEINFLIDQIHKVKSTAAQHIWLSISSPANCINIPQYLEHKIAGVILNMQRLTKLSLGVDPSNVKTVDLYDEFDPSIIWLTKRLISYLKDKHLKIILNNFYTPLDQHRLSMLLKIGVDGFALAPQYVLEAKKIIANIEKNSKD